MRQFILELKSFWRKGDLVLLLLCVLTSAFGCLMIASAKNYAGFTRYLVIVYMPQIRSARLHKNCGRVAKAHM